MDIIVLNGSPKGKMSATMQSINFIQKNFPQHHFKIIHISQNLPKIEKDEGLFREILDDIQSADAVIWGFPLYYFLVHSNYKRFIEMITERNAENVFETKYTAALSTSIHFFDHTAHNYIRAVCDDLNMNFVGSFSADMYDLVKRKERQRLLLFAEDFFQAIENGMPTSKTYRPLVYSSVEYHPGDPGEQTDARGKKILVITDSVDTQTNLGKMIERFRKSFSGEVQVCDLNQLNITGACQGCCQCGLENVCIYQGQDEFIDFYNSKVKSADILIFAGNIRDRYLSSRWKLFFDRSFFNGHSPSLSGKQMGYIVSGPLSQIANLRQILESYAGFQEANLVDIITDEVGDSGQIDALLDSLAKRLVQLSDQHYVKPWDFLVIGGRKVFRDDIWGRLRFVFQADDAFYRRHGMYDFPQKDVKMRVRNATMMLLTKIPRFKKEFIRRLKGEMIKPHQNVLER
jgi:multimeric flavodoxin WrbA